MRMNCESVNLLDLPMLDGGAGKEDVAARSERLDEGLGERLNRVEDDACLVRQVAWHDDCDRRRRQQQSRVIAPAPASYRFADSRHGRGDEEQQHVEHRRAANAQQCERNAQHGSCRGARARASQAAAVLSPPLCLCQGDLERGGCNRGIARPNSTPSLAFERSK